MNFLKPSWSPRHLSSGNDLTLALFSYLLMVAVTMSRPTSSTSHSRRSVHSVFSLLISLFIIELHRTALFSTADTIFVDQSLSGNQTITSSSGNFVLGFFQPGNSSNYYVAIWYRFSTSSSVWVTNRESPISDPTTSELKISEDGNLVLLDSSKSSIWGPQTSVYHLLPLLLSCLTTGTFSWEMNPTRLTCSGKALIIRVIHGFQGASSALTSRPTGPNTSHHGRTQPIRLLASSTLS